MENLIQKKFKLFDNLLHVQENNVNLIHEIMTENSHICCIINENCENIIEQTLLDSTGKVGIPYLLNYGNGKKYIAKISSFGKEIHFRNKPPISVKKIKKSRDIECMSIEIEELKYLGLDEFTNEILIAYIIEEVFLNPMMNKMYFGVKYLNGSICDNKGIHVMEYCDLGNLRQFIYDKNIEKYKEENVMVPIYGLNSLSVIKKEHLTSILSQVTTALHYLNETIEFTSGDLKVENIFVKKINTSGRYGFLNNDSDFRCKIADYGKSSCTFTSDIGERIRLYNWNKLSSYYLMIKDFNPIIRKENRKSYYIVDEFFVNETLVYLRHMGIPYYRSFDYYTFIISLLLIPEYYYGFFRIGNEDIIERFWNRIWINDNERNKIERKLEKAMRSSIRIGKESRRYGYIKIITLLQDRKLMCSALKQVVFI